MVLLGLVLGEGVLLGLVLGEGVLVLLGLVLGEGVPLLPGGGLVGLGSGAGVELNGESGVGATLLGDVELPGLARFPRLSVASARFLPRGCLAAASWVVLCAGMRRSAAGVNGSDTEATSAMAVSG